MRSYTLSARQFACEILVCRYTSSVPSRSQLPYLLSLTSVAPIAARSSLSLSSFRCSEDKTIIARCSCNSFFSCSSREAVAAAACSNNVVEGCHRFELVARV